MPPDLQSAFLDLHTSKIWRHARRARKPAVHNCFSYHTLNSCLGKPTRGPNIATQPNE